MAFDNQVSRDGTEGVVTEDVASEIIQSAVKSSAALRLFPHVRMSRKTRRLPVLSSLPVAYWVDGDTGLKATSNQAWDKKFLTAEELAVIIPIPEAVLDDSGFDIWAEIRPRVGESIGQKIDRAVFGGEDVPASWGTDGFNGLAVDAASAGNEYTLGTASQGEGGLGEDLNQLFATVEADGFDVSGVAAERTFRAVMRSARDTTGQKLADITADGGSVLGAEVAYLPVGTLNGEVAVAGDNSQGILGIRQDLTYKILTEAVISDEHGAIVYNLAQQDMVALRVVFRAAFQVANPITLDNQDDDTRYPFAVLHGH